MPRYVILRHDWPAPHHDLLVEAGDVLTAWRLPADIPSNEWVAAEPNADHRLVYLDYEGPVSGGRGSVIRWLAGEWGDGRVELREDGGWWVRLNSVGRAFLPVPSDPA